MIFLTEEDVRARCPQPGSTLILASGERLTPSAIEYANSVRVTVSQSGVAPAGACQTAAAEAPLAAPSAQPVSPACSRVTCATTWLDASTQVPKTHGRVIFRGKMDTLLASAILVETQFDPKDRLPHLLKDCLHDVKNWIMQVLAAEMSGQAPTIAGMGGMDMETLHAVSRDPATYLNTEHCMADASQGGNVALVNWLRALTRETEIAALRNLPGDSPVCCALNRLSSALYVLMLLTMAAQKGKDVSQFRG